MNNVIVLLYILSAIVFAGCSPEKEGKSPQDDSVYFTHGTKYQDTIYNLSNKKLDNPYLLSNDNTSNIKSSDMFEAVTASFELAKFDKDFREDLIIKLSNTLLFLALDKDKYLELKLNSKESFWKEFYLKVFVLKENKIETINEYLREAGKAELKLNSENLRVLSWSNSLLDYVAKENDENLLNETLSKVKAQFIHDESILNLVEKIHEYKVLKFSFYEKQASSWLESYYNSESTFSTVVPKESMYVEAVLGLYGEDLYQLLGDQFQEIYLSLNRVLDEVDLSLPDYSKYNPMKPGEIILDILNIIETLPNTLKEKNIAANIVSGLEVGITQVKPIIYKVLDDLDKVKKESELSANVNQVRSLILSLQDVGVLTPAIASRVLAEVDFPALINNLLQGIERDSEEEQLKTLVRAIVEIWRYKEARFDSSFAANEKIRELLNQRIRSGEFWLHMNLEQVFDLISGDEISANEEQIWREKVEALSKDFPWYMVVALITLTDEELNALEDESIYIDRFYDRWFVSGIRYMIKDYVKNKGIEDFVSFVNGAVNEALLKRLSKVFYRELSDFSSIFKSLTLQQIAKTDDDWTKNFYSNMKQVAADEIVSKILKKKKFFPGIEGDRISGLNIYNDHLSMNDSTVNRNFRSSASTVFNSLHAQVLQVQSGVLDQEQLNFRAFQFINKAISIAGVKDYYLNMTPSLMEPIDVRVQKKMDIFSYGEEKLYFSVPSQFKISHSFVTDIQGSISQKVAKPVEQAELLMAATSLMKLMSVWRTSPLDQEFHKLTYEATELFPKSAFFDLGIGLSSVVLRNLHKKGLVLLDGKRNRIFPEDYSDDSWQSKVVSVALVDVSSDKDSTQVRSIDISKFIVALSDFILEVEKLGRARSHTLLMLNDKNKTAMQELLSAIPLLKKLVVGLSNFLSSRLMSQDGRIFNSFDLKNGLENKQADLNTHLWAIRALSRTSNLWNAESYVWAATEIYFQLNRNFFDANYALYRSNYENSVVESLHISNTVLSLKELNAAIFLSKFKLEKESQEQLEKIILLHESQSYQNSN